MIKITRWWNFNPYNLTFDMEILCKRPRVDYRISEYVFEYINKNILIPNNISLAENYNIFLAMDTYDIKRHRNYFLYVSPYNTNTTKYCSLILSTTDSIKIHIDCCSTELNENIKPIDYAYIIYDMYSDFFVKHYKKKIKGKKLKDIIDEIKNRMDCKFITEFKYPALFENQKYLYDCKGGLEEIYLDGSCKKIIRPNNIPENIKDEYIKYYGG